MREFCDDLYILSDDRTIKCIDNGQLCAWNTPLSKKNLKNLNGIPVKLICYVKEDDLFGIEKVTLNKLIEYVIENYPNEYRKNVSELMFGFAYENDCYLIKNNKLTFVKEYLRCLIYDL